MILLDATGLEASRPGRKLFTDIDLTLSSGDRLGVVGINGTGKSTLLRVLAGSTEADAGTIRRGRGARVVMLDQADALPSGTVRDVVAPAAEPERQWEVDAVLDRLGISDLTERPTSRLSGGQAKRVALARALIAVGPGGGADDDSVLLILDEPTNHLDIDAIDWLEDRLAAHRGGLVLVTHDRHVLDRLTTRILELDRGAGHVHEGGYSSYLQGRAERDRRAEEAETVRRNLARRELEWLRRGAPARTRKPRARIEAATAIVTGRGGAPDRSGQIPYHAETPRLGDLVIELDGVGHHHDDGPWLFRHLDLALDPRERLGLVGPNGAGKTTLLRILAGRLEPVEGRRTVGPTVELVLWDQLGADLDPSQRVRDAIAGPNRRADWSDAALLERFRFDNDSQWAPIGTLSGGERRRLQLLMALTARPNVLLLDEPTNDLDLETLRALEDLLEDWPGALIVVSHDRAFLERTVTDVIVIDEHHDAERVPGGLAAWQENRRSRRRGGGRGLSTASGGRSGGASGDDRPRGGSHGRRSRDGRSSGGSGSSAGSAAGVTDRDSSQAGPGGSTSGGPGASVHGRSGSGSGGSDSGRPGSGGSGGRSGRRSPSTLRHLTKQAEKTMNRAQRDRDRLLEELEGIDPTDHTAYGEAGRAVAEAESVLSEAEDAWLALVDEAES